MYSFDNRVVRDTGAKSRSSTPRSATSPGLPSPGRVSAAGGMGLLETVTYRAGGDPAGVRQDPGSDAKTLSGSSCSSGC